MATITIDDVSVQIDDGCTVLDAARKIGLDLPAMCSLAGHAANTSCMCCLVRVDGARGIVPACATKVSDGLRVESETRELHDLRRTGIELLLADHAGDCHAPCQNTCPARMDVPNMLRLVAEGDYAGAIATVKREIALPAILGRVCPEVCENACRRGQHDSPAAICKIKQYVADKDLRSAAPYSPKAVPVSGKSVAIIGAGPTGLTAAYHLAQYGHRCTLFEEQSEVGGRLRNDFAQELPQEVLQAESNRVFALGVQLSPNSPIKSAAALRQLLDEFDAVLLATGKTDQGWLADCTIATTKSGVQVDHATRMTSRDFVFAAGNAVRLYKLVVQSVAEGKLAAECIDCWLRGVSPPDRHKIYESRLARLTSQELCDFCEGVPPVPRIDVELLHGPKSDEAARREAERCLECDCRALNSCLLHHYAAMYDCDAQRYRGEGRRYEGRLVGEHVTLELGKCILCGICVQLAADTQGAARLVILGRGMETRIGPPPGRSIDEALGNSAQQCADACPTGAIYTHNALAVIGVATMSSEST